MTRQETKKVAKNSWLKQKDARKYCCQNRRIEENTLVGIRGVIQRNNLKMQIGANENRKLYNGRIGSIAELSE